MPDKFPSTVNTVKLTQGVFSQNKGNLKRFESASPASELNTDPFVRNKKSISEKLLNAY